MIGFIALTALWIAFGLVLVVSEASLHDLWVRVGDLPMTLRVGIWVLFLPWMCAAAVWETSWPVIWRAVLVLGLAWATVYAFFPWRSNDPTKERGSRRLAGGGGMNGITVHVSRHS